MILRQKKKRLRFGRPAAAGDLIRLACGEKAEQMRSAHLNEHK